MSRSFISARGIQRLIKQYDKQHVPRDTILFLREHLEKVGKEIVQKARKVADRNDRKMIAKKDIELVLEL